MRDMLAVIRNFFTGAGENGERNFRLLYDYLTLPEHGIGLKKGVIPIYIAATLHLYKKDLVIKDKASEVKITADLLNGINEVPDNYSVFLENWNDEKAQYMAELEAIFKDHVIEREKAYNSFSYIVLAMNRWYMALPKYSKEMSATYCGMSSREPKKSVPHERKKFINSLKQTDSNPREYLFEKIFSIFGMRQFSLMVLDNIRETKKAFDTAKASLINTLASDIKTMFGNSDIKKASLTSVIRDWYEGLYEGTTNHLFPNNENKILELMKSVTNDETIFIQRLGKAVTSLRIGDWNAETIDVFLSDVMTFKNTVEKYERNRDNNTSCDTYKIAFINTEGHEIIKTFGKTQYSDRARLLLNDITTSLEEMGQSITEQEKRQVLMDLLETMC
jgi:hypothetical protein